MRSFKTVVATFVLFCACCAFSQKRREQYSPHVVVFDPARLTTYSTTELIDLLSSASIEKNARGEGIYSVLPPDRRELDSKSKVDPKLFVELKLNPRATDYTILVEQEIAKRRPFKKLSHVFGHTTDDVQQAWIADTLARMRGPEADAVLRPYVSGSTDDITYAALKYFAQACDAKALSILNRNYFKYPTSSLEWASLVRWFGECKYKPAVPNLVDTVSAASLNLGFASHLALRAIFPEAKIGFKNPEATREAWARYVRKHP